ncbi:MAG: 2-C-methyl-D-erythritol 4-phosphate cytidylyltransferase, partial [Acidimicrobiia bacterium]
MHGAATVAAGGRGLRLGADRPKQFLDIGGRSILEMSVAALAASDRIDEIVIALPADHLAAESKAIARAVARPL